MCEAVLDRAAVKAIRVTFYSNVWQLMVFPDRHLKDPNYSCFVKIKAALQSGRAQGFICESVGTLEAISRKDRASYFANRKPIVKVRPEKSGSSINLTVTVESDHDLHPVLVPS